MSVQMLNCLRIINCEQPSEEWYQAKLGILTASEFDRVITPTGNCLRIINCEQHSEEWYQARLGIPTASEFDRVITPTGKVSKQLMPYALDLASQLLVSEQDEKYKSPSMEKGNDREKEARELYEQTYLTKVERVGIIIRNDKFGYSPDGLIKQNGLIEIKSPDQNTHIKYIYQSKLPNKYKPQVQGGLLVSEREYCDFVSYHPKFNGELPIFRIRVYRDEQYISVLEEGLNRVVELRDKILTDIREKYETISF